MNKIFFTTFLVFFLVGSLFCDEDVSNSSSEEDLSWAEELTKEVNQKCFNLTGSEEAAEKLWDAVDRGLECSNDHINFTALYGEIAESMANDVYEGLFNKTCHTVEDVFQCIRVEQSFIDACLTTDEIAEKAILFKVIKKVAEYLCQEDGDVITMFLGGIPCFQSKQNELQVCAEGVYGNATEVSTKVRTTTYNKDENCGLLTNLRSCVIPVLETCGDEQLHAMLTNGLIEVVLEALTCDFVKREVEVTNEV